jgi:hypothetical protein
MNVKKRFRDFLVELKAEKAQALEKLDTEYKAKRQKIEQEYDLTGLVNSVEPCNLCDNDSVWLCSNCKYNLCRGCIDKIHETRSELMKKRIRTLKLSPLPLAQAKKKFIVEGLKCPQCRTTLLEF